MLLAPAECILCTVLRPSPFQESNVNYLSMMCTACRDLEAYAERLPAMGSIGSLMQDCMLAVQSDNMTNQTLGNLSSNLVCSFGSDCLVTH